MLNQIPVPLRDAKIQGLSAATGAVVSFGALMEAGAADSAFAKGSAANVAAFLLVVSAFHYVASWQCQEATSFENKNVDLVRIRVAAWRVTQRVTRILLPVLLVLLGWHVCKAVSSCLGLVRHRFCVVLHPAGIIGSSCTPLFEL